MNFTYEGTEIAKLGFEDFCAFLKENGNCKKAEFDKKIIKTQMKIFGFTAREIEDFYKYFSKTESNIFTYPADYCYEITLLQGLLIVKNKASTLAEKRAEFVDWVSNVDNWAHCDMVCAKFRCRKSEKRELFEFSKELALRDEEFFARSGVVMLMTFVSENAEEVFSVLEKVKYGRYYVDMAVAWLCATALITRKTETLDFLNKSDKINDFTYVKSLRKACESYRIPDVDKAEYKRLIAERKRQNA